MTTKKLWLCWLYLFILCAVLGFIPRPTGFGYALLLMLALCFFIPGVLLAYRAHVRDDAQTLLWVRLVSAIALGLDVLLICLNMATALLSKAWGDVLYVMLVVFSSPMVCGQVWVVTLFGWAFLLIYSAVLLKKDR